MFNKNAIWAGLLSGLLLPTCTFVLLYEIFSLLENQGAVSSVGFSENFRERTLAIVALATNLWLMSLYRRRRWELTMRGVVIATGILALAWVWIFGMKLF